MNVPKDFSISLIPYTKSLNSLGFKEHEWSGPGSDLSIVKCFSIECTPFATAAKHAKLLTT